ARTSTRVSLGEKNSLMSMRAPAAKHPRAYADERFFYEIPITPVFPRLAFLCRFIHLLAVTECSKKRVTLDGCHIVRSETRGAPARAARADLSRADDHACTNRRRDFAGVPAFAGPAADRSGDSDSSC